MLRVEPVLTPGQTAPEFNEISPGWDKKGIEQCSRVQGKFSLVLALHFYLKYLMDQGLLPAGTSYFTRSTAKLEV